MKPASNQAGGAEPTGIGWKRVLALGLLLAAVAAVAYLDQVVAGGFDLTLIYFSIVLTAAILLPRWVAVGVAAAVAIVSIGVGGSSGLPLLVNGAARLVVYGYVALLTNQWESERRRLLRMSRIDELTGLYNLRALREQLPVWLGPAVRTGRSMAILMLDVDGFKAVNDRLGHGTGNQLLQEIANVLRFATRVGDAVFRFGGDEFVILLSDTAGKGAEAVARRIQQIYEEKGQTLRQTGVRVSLSAGIAVFPSDGETPDVLLAHADEALYRAKTSGASGIARYGLQAA